jgi:cell wall-associated NlpC family hydrolase
MNTTSEKQTARIIAAARSQTGVAFKHQGRNPGQFLDCAGLAAFVAQSIGVDYNEWPGYGRQPCNGLLESVLDRQPGIIRVSASQPGDMLLMRFGAEPQHLAFLTDINTIIHCYSTVGCVVEHRLDSVWVKRIARMYRFLEARPAPDDEELSLSPLKPEGL